MTRWFMLHTYRQANAALAESEPKARSYLSAGVVTVGKTCRVVMSGAA